MPPRAKADNLPHRVIRDVVFAGQLRDRRAFAMSLSNFSNVARPKASVEIALTECPMRLRRCVGHIVGVCSGKQMRRAHAVSYVACMTHQCLGIQWHKRISNSPCQPMHQDHSLTVANNPITVRVRKPGPQPTFARVLPFFNVAPKSLLNRSASCSHGTYCITT